KFGTTGRAAGLQRRPTAHAEPRPAGVLGRASCTARHPTWNAPGTMGQGKRPSIPEQPPGMERRRAPVARSLLVQPLTTVNGRRVVLAVLLPAVSIAVTSTR